MTCDLCKAPDGVTIWRLPGGRWSQDGARWWNRHGVACDPPKVVQRDSRVVSLEPFEGLQLCGWCRGLTLARRRSQVEMF